MNSFIFIYITNPSKEKATEIANYLLKKRLVACANIFQITSLYHWENKINNEDEFALILKTLEKNFEKIKKEVKKIHPYSTPCIIKIPVSSNKEYFDWIKKETI